MVNQRTRYSQRPPSGAAMTYNDDPSYQPAHRRSWSANLGRLRVLIPSIVTLALFGVAALVYPVAASTTTESLWSDLTTPRTLSHADPKPVELGVKFYPKVAGTVTAIRFYKGPANTGSHRGNLWTIDGT